MKRPNVLPAALLAIPLAVPLFAQPQVGGGTCSSSTLSGTYSFLLAGRAVGSPASYTAIEQGIGTATFDGQSNVTFNLTTNTNKAIGTPQKLQGTYSIQANCTGAINLTSGDTGSFVLGAYDQGVDYFFTGEDGTYSITASGNTLPTTACSNSTFTGTYSFNGNGFQLSSGTVSTVNEISGLIMFDGAGNITANWYVSTKGSAATASVKGTYTVASGCTATATVTDTSNNSYSLVFTITAANGNFSFTGGNPATVFSGSGRIE